MAYRLPYLEVEGPDGTDQVPVWGARLIGVKLVTRLDDQSDEATLMFSNKKPYQPDPADGTKYTVKVGWSKDSLALNGVYTLQRIHHIGEPRQGEQVHYVCRAADFVNGDLKKVGSQHFAADNGNNTLGDVFTNLFAGANTSVEVTPDIAQLPLPNGHLLRWNQSAIDFATDLANEHGATLKPMGGKIIVLKRDSGQSVSGADLSTVRILHDATYQYDVEHEPRFAYQEVTVPWFNPSEGKLKDESSTDAGGSGGADGVPHPAASQDHAKTISSTVAREWQRLTATGLFVTVGDPSAVAGAKVECVGFPGEIDTIKWQAVTVTHDIMPGAGWTTSTETDTQAV